jgi:serine beta-lactamase-like protein LACTB, mitochondrial
MKRTEATLAILFAAAIIGVGGVAIYFVGTMSVHSDPAAVPSSAAAVPAGRDFAAGQEARRLARSLVVDENLPALSVAVAHRGRVVWAEAFGWADIERRVAATPTTRFRIGAASKALAAAAAGLLHDRGRLDLDAPVQRYVPAYPQKQWAVTTRQLLGDVAGVHHLRGESESLPGRHCASLDDALRIFSEDPLLFRPGSRYRYSVYGWVLVSAVVEGAAGEPFPQFMKREVFDPLGMADTTPDEAAETAGRSALYFPRAAMDTRLGMQEAPSADYSCWAGAGAFLSTPSDLARFGAAMMNPGFLNAATSGTLLAPVQLDSGAPTGYALGWKVEDTAIGGAIRRVLSHRGNPAGGSVSLMVVPDLDLVVAAAANVSHAKGVAPFAGKVAQAFAKPRT